MNNKLTCSFCSKGNLVAISPVKNEPSFRCSKCNVRIIITNQSYLPTEVKKEYWFLVNNKLLTTQSWE